MSKINVTNIKNTTKEAIYNEMVRLFNAGISATEYFKISTKEQYLKETKKADMADALKAMYKEEFKNNNPEYVKKLRELANEQLNKISNKEEKIMDNNTIVAVAVNDSVSVSKEENNMTNNIVIAMSKDEVSKKTKNEIRVMLESVGVEMSNNQFKNTNKGKLVEMLEKYLDPSKKMIMVEVKEDKEENIMANAQNISVAVVANEQVTAIPVPVPVAVAETVTATPVVVESTEDRIVTRIDENTVNIAYPKGVEIKAEGCNPNKPMTVTVEKPAPQRKDTFDPVKIAAQKKTLSPQQKTDGVIKEIRTIAANNKEKGYGTVATDFILKAVICTYLGIPNYTNAKKSGMITKEIETDIKKVVDYLVKKGIIKTVVIEDSLGYKFYDPSIYDGSRNGLYDGKKFKITGAWRVVSYKVF